MFSDICYMSVTHYPAGTYASLTLVSPSPFTEGVDITFLFAPNFLHYQVASACIQSTNSLAFCFLYLLHSNLEIWTNISKFPTSPFQLSNCTIPLKTVTSLSLSQQAHAVLSRLVRQHSYIWALSIHFYDTTLFRPFFLLTALFKIPLKGLFSSPFFVCHYSDFHSLLLL